MAHDSCNASKHVTQLIEEFQENNNVYLVTKKASCGNLYDYQKAQPDPRLPERLVRGIFQQIACGVQDIHEQEIVHRDLKHMNILVSDKDRPSGPKIKITDFGLAMKVPTNDFFVSHGRGTPGFMAPEVILQKPCNSKIDIWGLGVMLYGLLFATLPFVGKNDKQINHATLNSPL